MRKSYICCLLVLCVCTLFSCSNNNEREVVVSVHPNGNVAYVEYYAKDDSVNVVRTMRYYFEGGKQEEVHYNKNGVRDGVTTFWYQNGEKMMMGTYKNGVQDGVFTQWFDNGKVDYIAEYKNGRPSGTWKYYSVDGKLLSEQKMQ
ncbi:MAG: hypothetical protein MJ197_06205 [Bacteroidales bacterium]|nr:hypothetical protein [Bacteroidales bacterium]